MTEEFTVQTTPNNLQDVVFPDAISVQSLYNEVNASITAFQQKNQKVQPNILMVSIMEVFLSYPWGWLKQMGTEDRYVEAISAHAQAFVSTQKVIADNKSDKVEPPVEEKPVKKRGKKGSSVEGLAI